MDERRAFLDEVLENRDDDIPRLIYADWLEEQGDPRGEFIRVQCQLAETSRLEPEFYDLAGRSLSLMEEYGADWAAELKQDVRKTAFHRGFIDSITMTARAFAQSAEELFRTIPVHWLRFNYVKGVGPKLAETTALENLRHLDLSGLKIPIADLTALLNSPYLRNLLGLKLRGIDAPVHRELGKSLASMRAAETLRELTLPSSSDASEFVKAMLNGEGFPELRSLSLGAEYEHAGQDVSNLGKLFVPKLESLKIRGVIRVADAENYANLPLRNLKRLDLKSTYIPMKGVNVFADSGAFDAVEYLNMGECDLTVKTIEILLRDGRLQNCRSLDLHGTRKLAERTEHLKQFILALAGHESFQNLQELVLSDLLGRCLGHLAQSPQLCKLRSIELSRSVVSRDDGSALVNGTIHESLRELKLVASMIDDGFLDELSRGQFPNLLSLEFDGRWDMTASVHERALLKLIESEALPNLRSLNLDHANLTAATLDSIAKRSNFPELRVLSFNGNRASDQGMRDVLHSEYLPNLRKLSMTNVIGLGNRPKAKKEYGNRIEV
jgi:uncharacterized protein (TIGR02996 family)